MSWVGGPDGPVDFTDEILQEISGNFQEISQLQLMTPRRALGSVGF
jgi:hypothetical protein